ncbi:hypothetical protein NMG60_11006081 [Bertholletia excelsa]
MASAVLASGNEAFWGERKVYTGKYNENSATPHFNKLNPNPKVTSPNPALNRQIHDSYGRNLDWQNHEPAAKPALPAAAAALGGSPPRDRGPNDPYGGHLTFDLAACSKAGLKELKRRLRSELEQVRSLRARIENSSFKYGSSHPGSRFSGSYVGGRDVSRGTLQPPPFQQDAALVPSLSVTSKASQNCWPAEFVAAKNKAIPPMNKKGPGRKRAAPFVAGVDPKRHASLESPLEKLLKSMMTRCGQILGKLMKHKHGWVFNKPVDVVGLGLHDYHQIIKHPMDLGTVKMRLSRKEYRSPLDFASDVRLTFNNAMTYNPKGQDVYTMAETLLALFEQMFNTVYKRYEAEHQIVAAAQPVSQTPWALEKEPILIEDDVRRSSPLAVALAKGSNSVLVQETLSSSKPVDAVITPLSMPARQATAPAPPLRSTPKLPKPRAKDKDKWPMSFEEKAKLGSSLQSLPMEKINQMLEIIKRSNSLVAQEGDEIELDIEALDNETLWELDRFVSCHKKGESKVKRQELRNNAILAQETAKKSPEPEPIPDPTTQTSRKADTGEEDVDIGEEIPFTSFSPVRIEKDSGHARSESSSSGSSSSSSDSSSSDSDTGSSSRSDSEDSVRSPFVGSIEANIPCGTADY